MNHNAYTNWAAAEEARGNEPAKKGHGALVELRGGELSDVYLKMHRTFAKFRASSSFPAAKGNA